MLAWLPDVWHVSIIFKTKPKITSLLTEEKLRACEFIVCLCFICLFLHLTSYMYMWWGFNEIRCCLLYHILSVPVIFYWHQLSVYVHILSTFSMKKCYPCFKLVTMDSCWECITRSRHCYDSIKIHLALFCHVYWGLKYLRKAGLYLRLVFSQTGVYSLDVDPTPCSVSLNISRSILNFSEQTASLG